LCRIEGLEEIEFRTDTRFLSESIEEERMRKRFLEALEELAARFEELANKGEVNIKAEFLNEALRIARDYGLDCKATILLVFVAGIQYVAVTPGLAVDFLIQQGLPIAILPLPRPKPKEGN
jgi:hypothetical protein